jgi:hypothetical protein
MPVAVASFFRINYLLLFPKCVNYAIFFKNCVIRILQGIQNFRQMLSKDNINTQYFGDEIKTLVTPIKEEQLQAEDAGTIDLIFEKKKRLYLEMKELNQRLDKCLEQFNLKSGR